jgi:hypothetical protein
VTHAIVQGSVGKPALNTGVITLAPMNIAVFYIDLQYLRGFMDAFGISNFPRAYGKDISYKGGIYATGTKGSRSV